VKVDCHVDTSKATLSTASSQVPATMLKENLPMSSLKQLPHGLTSKEVVHYAFNTVSESAENRIKELERRLEKTEAENLILRAVDGYVVK